MKLSPRALNAAALFIELTREVSRLSSNEREEVGALIESTGLARKASFVLRELSSNDRPPKVRPKRSSGFGEFRFEDVMQRLRNAVMHSAARSDDAAELDWLLKIILTSPAVFDSVRELDNFLSNVTAAEHGTKSTGRDRVVEWYFRYINSLTDVERNQVYLKIARHIFAQPKSNYREWKEVLSGNAGR